MTLKITKALDLEAFKSQINKQKVPIKLAFKFSKLFSKLEESTNFYREKLQEIIDTYAERDENGDMVPANDGTGVQIQKDKIAECQEQLNELTSLEVEVPDITFTLDELEPFNLSIEQFDVLLPFITE